MDTTNRWTSQAADDPTVSTIKINKDKRIHKSNKWVQWANYTAYTSAAHSSNLAPLPRQEYAPTWAPVYCWV